MYCQHCGALIPDGDRFCARCGAPAGQEDSAPAPYTQPPGSYEPYAGFPPPQKRRMNKKAKGLMWGGIGLAAALAVAAVLIFVVFAGGAWPLSGNTVQTRFFNDGVCVFAGAFSDFAAIKTPDISREPFDMDISVSADQADLDMSLSMAYDNQALGVAVDAGVLPVKLLLLEDTLYTETFGSVVGMRFDTAADLSGPMPLKERLAALTDDDAVVDYKKLAEALLNSIGEDCFEKTGDAFTLEMAAGDVQDMLDEFSDKLDADDELKSEVDNMMKSMGAGNTDIDEMLSQMVAALDFADFNLTLQISYAGGKPSELAARYQEDGSVTLITFGYEQQKGGKHIALEIVPEDKGNGTAIEMTVGKTPEGLALSGSAVPGQGEAYDFEGGVTWSRDTLEGRLDIVGRSGGDTESIVFERTLKVGMPEEAVEDDARFAMDVDDAQVMDIEDLQGYSAPF